MVPTNLARLSARVDLLKVVRRCAEVADRPHAGGFQLRQPDHGASSRPGQITAVRGEGQCPNRSGEERASARICTGTFCRVSRSCHDQSSRGSVAMTTDQLAVSCQDGPEHRLHPYGSGLQTSRPASPGHPRAGSSPRGWQPASRPRSELLCIAREAEREKHIRESNAGDPKIVSRPVASPQTQTSGSWTPASRRREFRIPSAERVTASKLRVSRNLKKIRRWVPQKKAPSCFRVRRSIRTNFPGWSASSPGQNQCVVAEEDARVPCPVEPDARTLGEVPEMSLTQLVDHRVEAVGSVKKTGAGSCRGWPESPNRSEHDEHPASRS